MSEINLKPELLGRFPGDQLAGRRGAATKRAIPSLLRRPLFVILFVIPNLTALLYFFFIAAPIYISTAALIVFNPSQTSSSIVSLLSGGSSDGSAEEAYILQQYIASWEEFQNLRKPLDLARHFGSGDMISRYGGLITGFESDDVRLWHYYQSHVKIDVDVKSGIVQLEVRGYDPSFACNLANALLRDSIRHMDKMNAQQEQDFVQDAQLRKQQLNITAHQDEMALDDYRSRIGVYDPQALYAADLTLLNNLIMKDVDLETQYKVLSETTPNNPEVNDIAAAITMIKQKEAVQQDSLSKIAPASTTYEDLVLKRDNDAALLQQATVALQDAELKATQNRYYLNIISMPSQPFTPELPRRLLWISGTFLITIILWGLLR